MTQTSHESPAPSTPRPSPVRVFAYGGLTVLAIAAFIGAFFSFRATRTLSTNPAVVEFARVLGISVAKINGLSIPYADYIEDRTLLTTFDKQQSQLGQSPLTEEEISDQVLSRLAVNALIMDYAKKYGVSASQDEVESSPYLARIIAPFGTKENAETKMQELYGLAFDTYVEKVVRPVVLEEKLVEAFSVSTKEEGKEYEEEQARARHILFPFSDTTEDETIVKKAAQKVLDRIRAGEDFAALAKEFGSDGTKDKGGDLGWFGKGRMVPEFETAVFSAEPGTLLPELVKTNFGYHIIQVEGKRTGRNYFAFMGDRLKTANVEIFIPNLHNPFIQQDLSGAQTVEMAPADAAETK